MYCNINKSIINLNDITWFTCKLYIILIQVVLSPLFIGFAFGPKMLAGFLPGAIVSGVQMAISAANTGGAWDNAKKYIQSGALVDDHGNQIRKGS